MHGGKPGSIPAFAVADAAVDAVALVFLPGDALIPKPALHPFVAVPRDACARLGVAVHRDDLVHRIQGAENFLRFGMENSHFLPDALPAPVHGGNRLQTESVVPLSRVGMGEEGRLKNPDGKPGQAAGFRSCQCRVVFRAQVALQPNQLDLLPFRRHTRA